MTEMDILDVINDIFSIHIFEWCCQLVQLSYHNVIFTSIVHTTACKLHLCIAPVLGNLTCHFCRRGDPGYRHCSVNSAIFASEFHPDTHLQPLHQLCTHKNIYTYYIYIVQSYIHVFKMYYTVAHSSNQSRGK